MKCQDKYYSTKEKTMTKEKIIYKKRVGVNTKDTLRTIADPDQHWLKTVMLGYLCLESADPRIDFKVWFNKPNENLPRQPQHNNQFNSPKSFSQGILDKLEQDPRRRDLSPRQCDGIEELTKLMTTIYDIPKIEFEERGSPKSGTEFNNLFGK